MAEENSGNIDVYADEILSDPLLDETGDPVGDIQDTFISDKEDQGEERKQEPLKTIKDVMSDKVDKKIQKDIDAVARDRYNPMQPVDPPIINDPTDILDINIQPGLPLQKAITDPVRNDKLLASIRREESTQTLFNGIMQEIAEELAYLKAYRREHFLSDQDTTDVSFKRVKALRELVDTLVKREAQKEKKEGKIDFYGDRFESVMKFLLEKVVGAFEKVGVPDQFHEIFLAQLGQDLEGFEKEVEKIYYGK